MGGIYREIKMGPSPTYAPISKLMWIFAIVIFTNPLSLALFIYGSSNVKLGCVASKVDAFYSVVF